MKKIYSTIVFLFSTFVSFAQTFNWAFPAHYSKESDIKGIISNGAHIYAIGDYTDSI
jgi:hypothetical protein